MARIKTFRQLRDRLNRFSEEDLDARIRVFDPNDSEVYEVSFNATRLDKRSRPKSAERPVLVISWDWDS